MVPEEPDGPGCAVVPEPESFCSGSVDEPVRSVVSEALVVSSSGFVVECSDASLGSVVLVSAGSVTSVVEASVVSVPATPAAAVDPELVGVLGASTDWVGGGTEDVEEVGVTVNAINDVPPAAAPATAAARASFAVNSFPNIGAP